MTLKITEPVPTWQEILDDLESLDMKKISLQKMIDQWPPILSAVLITILLLVIFYYGRQANAFYEHQPVKLHVYAFSTQEEAFSEFILPEFEQYWEDLSGQEIGIEAVFGPSATLASEINLGAPADIAILSNAHHINWLKMGHKVNQEAEPILIGQTPMVIVTKPGNPHDIQDYADLTKPGLCILHSDPHSSGGGEWAILAEFGSALRETGSAGEAKTQVDEIWDNVCFMGTSARATMEVFAMGVGDALITYEQDALLAQADGVQLEIVYPPRTIFAEHMAVAVDDNNILRERKVVQAFMDYLVSEPAQEAFSRYHLRPISMVENEFPLISDQFTVEELGGWTTVYPELVDEFWQDGILPRLDLTPTSLIVDSDG